jgi:hypothetical protein
MRSRRVSSASKIPDCVVAHRSDRCFSPVRPVPTGQTGLELLQLRLRFFGLGFVDQPRNCHTRFSEENQVLAICMPGSSFIHIVTS